MPLSPVYFVDRDLGTGFPRLLRAAGLKVEAHADHFPHDLPDPLWIAEVAAKGWLAVTHDRHIGRRPNELRAVFDAGLGLFVLIGHAPVRVLAENFLRMHDAVAAFAQRHERPFIARVYRPTPTELARDPAARGRVERWKP